MVLLEQVQQQYETLPYPHRDPERELELLRQPSIAEIPRVLEAFWGGRRAVDGTFRVLDAGCGTGDNTVFLAEQLRGTGAQVVALDFSSTSLGIARRRIELRGLTDDVTFVHSPLEAAPALDIGPFDFIVTTGVLHHLDSPEVGLRALRDVLKPDGGIGVMVYARYGREPVYAMQALLRLLAPRTMSEAERLRVLRTTLAALPRDHRVVRGLMDSPMLRTEIEASDAGAYDLLLHSQDRPYTVPEVYEWLEGADMTLREFSVPRRYESATYLADARLRDLPAAERHAVAELLHGSMKKHEFYAARATASIPAAIATDDPAARPSWTSWKFGEALAAGLKRPGNQLRFTFGEERDCPVAGDAITRSLLGAIDGVRDVAGIFEITMRQPDRPSARQVQRRWLEAVDPLRAVAALAMHRPE
ncbi:MAG: class I SAM-dependent methyltransferase [Chloroflexi bacterium]|nr:class I SAM-dependent methyltransferase [Chloroflexota bacterium]